MRVLIALILFGASFAAAANITSSVVLQGDVSVIGALSKGSGTFMIDHPLDSRNSLLVFSFVESPDVKNVYDGIITLDENGEATVALPDYFLVLNMEYRYLATPLGTAMPDLHLQKEIGRKYAGLFGPIVFKLAGGAPQGKVSWQATGVRHDRFIEKFPIVPEVRKEDSDLIEPGECLFEPLCD